jgi:hypothetical protein
MTSSFSDCTVVNLPRDFYADIASSSVPPFSFVVTNPPYSSEHKSRCLNWLTDKLGGLKGEGYACLLPKYCISKAYYASAVGRAEKEGFKTFVLNPVAR